MDSVGASSRRPATTWQARWQLDVNKCTRLPRELNLNRRHVFTVTSASQCIEFRLGSLERMRRSRSFLLWRRCINTRNQTHLIGSRKSLIEILWQRHSKWFRSSEDLRASWGSHSRLHAMMNFERGQASAPRKQLLTSEKDLSSAQHIWMPGVGRDQARHMLGHGHSDRSAHGEPGPRILEATYGCCMLNMEKQCWRPSDAQQNA